MSDTLLSVVIPTYNRYKYLKGSIEAFKNTRSSEIELIIQDNTEDNGEILSFLGKIVDSRIKYYHEKGRVSVVENSDKGILNSCGEYVILIGDDDTVCESIVYAAKFCKENGIDTCLSELPGFNWPDMEFIGKEKQSNLFYIKPVNGHVKKIDLKEQINISLKYADGIPEMMPRIYHGITSRKCLNKIMDITGSFFPGPSPDMASSMAISLVASNAVFISDYLMVSGYGYKSARGEGNRQKHYGKISEKPWLPKDTEILWDRNIPKIFSGETIIAQSLIQALQRMGKENLIRRYSYGALYAVFFVRHTEARKYMLGFFAHEPIRIIKFAIGFLKRFRYRSFYKSTHTSGNYQEFDRVATLSEAQSITDNLRGESMRYTWR